MVYLLDELPRVVYLAGPVTGRPGLNAAMFGYVEHIAERAGYAVCNPLRIVPASSSWAAAMVRCIWHLLLCDEVWLLPEWESSRGARLEYRLARGLGLPVRIAPVVD